MASIKKLASQTAYYGISSILGRMLNYALVPLHTRVLSNQQDYGVVGEMYSYVTFLNIIFLYGMETAFFRFASKSQQPKEIYNNVFSSVLFSSILLCSLLFISSPTILSFLADGTNTTLYRIEYLYLFIAIMGLDAIVAIPFAKLRLDNRPIKFAAVRIANISINVLLNIYFLVFCPYWKNNHPESILASFYTEKDLVYYIFFSGFIASLSTVLFLYREIVVVKINWVWLEMKPMLIFAIPLLFAGLAGMTNETLDRILLKYYLPGTMEERLAQVGIYNAAYKLSIFMTLAVQAFRMAAEPFFFSIHKNTDSTLVYAKVMNYFVLVCTLIFLGVVFHLQILEYILGSKYRDGLGVVPVLLFANLFLGIYLNLSIWYKVTDKTKYGAYITFLGAAITIILNILFIPIWGYMGSAYTTAICYVVMAVVCYFLGQKFYHVPYQLKTVARFLGMMLVFYVINVIIKKVFVIENLWINQAIDSFMFLVYVFYSYLQFKKLNNANVTVESN